MKRNEINASNSKVNVLKNEYTKELNTVNHYYWPIMAQLDKQYGNLRWYLTLASCFEAAIIVCLLFFEIFNLYWVLGSNGVGIGIILLVLRFFNKCKKKRLATQKEWDKALEQAEKLKVELDSEIDKATKLMIEFLSENDNEDVSNNIGASYEDILSYYNHWVDNN